MDHLICKKKIYISFSWQNYFQKYKFQLQPSMVKLKAGASPGPVLSPVSSLLDAPHQLNVRGPDGRVKGDNQVDSQPPGKFSPVTSSIKPHQVDLRGPPRRVEGGDHNFAYLHNVAVPPATGSLKAPQLEVRGPAGMVEGEVHGQHSSQVPGQVSPAQYSLETPQLDVRGPAGRWKGNSISSTSFLPWTSGSDCWLPP